MIVENPSLCKKQPTSRGEKAPRRVTSSIAHVRRASKTFQGTFLLLVVTATPADATTIPHHDALAASAGGTTTKKMIDTPTMRFRPPLVLLATLQHVATKDVVTVVRDTTATMIPKTTSHLAAIATARSLVLVRCWKD